MSGNVPQESKAISSEDNHTLRNPKEKVLSLISLVLKAWGGQVSPGLHSSTSHPAGGSTVAPTQGGCGEALKEGLESRTGVVAEATVRVFLCARPVYMICRLDFISFNSRTSL